MLADGGRGEHFEPETTLTVSSVNVTASSQPMRTTRCTGRSTSRPPDFGIMALIRVTIERHQAKEGVAASHLWKFHEWARSEAESQWAKIEGSLR
jgi:hypothetical protein